MSEMKDPQGCQAACLGLAGPAIGAVWNPIWYPRCAPSLSISRLSSASDKGFDPVRAMILNSAKVTGSISNIHPHQALRRSLPRRVCEVKLSISASLPIQPFFLVRMASLIGSLQTLHQSLSVILSARLEYDDPFSVFAYGQMASTLTS